MASTPATAVLSVSSLFYNYLLSSPHPDFRLERWLGCSRVLTLIAMLDLKVPKCEIFDRSDFPDFYTIKSRRKGDFGVKTKKC